MCDKVRTAIELIKTQKKRTISKGEIVVLFQQVASDLGKQGERMTNLEKEVSCVKEEMRIGFDEVNKKLRDVTDLIRGLKRESLLQKILLGENAKYFWFAVIITLLIIGGILGVPATGFNGLISLGG